MHSIELQLATFVSDRVPEVLTGDPGRFRQIITNLVGNSVKVSSLSILIYYLCLLMRVKISSFLFLNCPGPVYRTWPHICSSSFGGALEYGDGCEIGGSHEWAFR